MTARFALLLAAALLSAPLTSRADADALYREHCAACHGPDRLGGTGPALLPENLERLRKPAAEKTVAEGRIATQMPAFKDKLGPEDIKALVAFVYTPPAKPVVWGEAEIRDSRVQLADPASLPARPSFQGDPMNVFVVVESGDHHVTILDGDRLEPMIRFPSRYALHGGPKFTPDGRFVFFASRDGWISKYDIWNLKMVAEVRAGINTRNLAVSGDGRYVMVANYLPHTLVLLDARDLSPLKVIAVRDENGRSSRVSAVYDAAPRGSFVAALKDIPEVWEIFYTDNPPQIFKGFVHDYHMGEGLAEKDRFPVRTTRLDDYLDDFFFDPSYAYLIGAARDGGKGQVVNLDIRRKIADVPLPGLPHLGSGITWEREGHTVLATPNLKEGMVTVIDMKTWKPVKEIKTLGPGFFMRSHENTRYAWVDNFSSPDANDTLLLIDKNTLQVAGSVTPAPGKTAAHVEFTRDGKFALVSVWEMDGAIVVYEADTLREVKRIPMKKPVGKYNVYNKVTRSSGTSH
jgi:dihydro-heme d1 dehydrogenase